MTPQLTNTHPKEDGPPRPGLSWPAAVRFLDRFDRVWRSILPFLLLTFVWWGIKIWFDLDTNVLPSPADVVASVGPLIERGILFDYITQSLVRIAVAALLGVAIGVPVGLLLGSSRLLSLAFRPYLQFFQALSGIAWLPMIILWFGFTESAIQALILYTVLFPVIFNTMSGVRTVPAQLASAVRVLGAGRLRVIRDVWLPGAVPSIVVGLRLGIAYGWRALIAGEMVIGANGLGYLLFQARSFHMTPRIVAGMIFIGLLWTLIDNCFLRPVERQTAERWGMVQR